MRSTDENSKPVQTPGGDDEPDTVHHGALPRREFSSVRVAVKYGKRPDDNRRQREIELGFHRDDDAQQERRCRDADFDARYGYTNQAKETAEGHHDREGNGKQPKRGWTELRAPKPDRNHRQHMVKARDWVPKSAEEPLRLTILNVRHHGRHAH